MCLIKWPVRVVLWEEPLVKESTLTGIMSAVLGGVIELYMVQILCAAGIGELCRVLILCPAGVKELAKVLICVAQ